MYVRSFCNTRKCDCENILRIELKNSVKGNELITLIPHDVETRASIILYDHII